MPLYDYAWICMTMYDPVRLSMTMYIYDYDFEWLCMSMFEYEEAEIRYGSII